MDPTPAGTEPIKAPGLMKLLLEARAPFEYAASLAAAPWLLSAPRGDGHAVLVYPGFLATDFSTRPLRRLLRTLGHDAHGWGQGRNVGPRGDTLQQALQRIEDLHRSSGRKLSLVGWSLGGLYARELAKQAPHAVRAVVTLGSPFAGPMQANNAWRTYQWVHRHRPPEPPSRAELDAAEPALPGLDPGCEHCQAHGAPLIPMLVLALDTERADETIDAAPPNTPTPPRARPERPNWPTLA